MYITLLQCIVFTITELFDEFTIFCPTQSMCFYYGYWVVISLFHLQQKDGLMFSYKRVLWDTDILSTDPYIYA